MFCQGDGYSLEINGPLHTRERSLLVIRRRRGLWTDSAADRDFTPLCCMITCMHLRCTEKGYSCSLEFCLGGFYNNKPQLVLHTSVPRAGVCIVCLLCVSCFVFVSFRSQQPRIQPVHHLIIIALHFLFLLRLFFPLNH